jgi:hypothetical protein
MVNPFAIRSRSSTAPARIDTTAPASSPDGAQQLQPRNPPGRFSRLRSAAVSGGGKTARAHSAPVALASNAGGPATPPKPLSERRAEPLRNAPQRDEPLSPTTPFVAGQKRYGAARGGMNGNVIVGNARVDARIDAQKSTEQAGRMRMHDVNVRNMPLASSFAVQDYAARLAKESTYQDIVQQGITPGRAAPKPETDQSATHFREGVGKARATYADLRTRFSDEQAGLVMNAMAGGLSREEAVARLHAGHLKPAADAFPLASSASDEPVRAPADKGTTGAVAQAPAPDFDALLNAFDDE